MSKTKNRKGFGSIYKRIDVPGDKLFTCFYCGCIATDDDHVPPLSRLHDYQALYDKHPPLLVPACSECNDDLSSSLQPDVYARFEQQKKKLTRKLGKFIRYGEIWTEEAAEYADFSGNFEVFVESAQRMATISQARLDWMHWPVMLDGTELELCEEKEPIKVNGKSFLSLDHLFDYARKVDKIPIKYLQSVLDIVGLPRVEYAYNFCKTVPVKTDNQMREVLCELSEN